MSNKPNLKKKTGNKVTSVAEWKKGKTSDAQPLELPSGKTCLARPVGIEVFFKAGSIPNSLMGIVSNALAKGTKGESVELEGLTESLAENPEMLADMITMADRVTIGCVIEPQVYPIPAEGEDRDDEKLYVDEIDMEDKFFIMGFGLGGTRDLEPFREATAIGMGSVPAVEDVRDSAIDVNGDY